MNDIDMTSCCVFCHRRTGYTSYYGSSGYWNICSSCFGILEVVFLKLAEDMNTRLAALEAANAELQRQVEDGIAKYKGFWDAHFLATAEDGPEPMTVTVASTGPFESSSPIKADAWTTTYYPALYHLPSPPPPCSECGSPAQVEVAGEGHLRPLCWACSGCGERYWLPDRHDCFRCGKPASAQETLGDGLTRPLCPWCAGTFDEE